MSNFYLCVELAGDAPTIAESVRTALADFVYPDEYNMALEGDKLALEVWTCAQAAQAPLIAAVHELARRCAADQVTSVYIEDDRGSTEQYLGPWQAVSHHLAQEHQARLTALNQAFHREMLRLNTSGAAPEAFAITEGW